MTHEDKSLQFKFCDPLTEDFLYFEVFLQAIGKTNRFEALFYKNGFPCSECRVCIQSFSVKLLYKVKCYLLMVKSAVKDWLCL